MVNGSCGEPRKAAWSHAHHLLGPYEISCAKIDRRQRPAPAFHAANAQARARDTLTEDLRLITPDVARRDILRPPFGLPGGNGNEQAAAGREGACDVCERELIVGQMFQNLHAGNDLKSAAPRQGLITLEVAWGQPVLEARGRQIDRSLRVLCAVNLEPRRPPDRLQQKRAVAGPDVKQSPRALGRQ